MIDARIENLASNYVTSCNRRTVKEPLLYLDYSWQSISTLELMSAEVLYGIKILNKQSPQPLSLLMLDFPARVVVKSVAAYLTVMAYNCWQLFATDVVAFYDERNSICISGRLANGQTIIVAVEEALFEVYAGVRALPKSLEKYENALLSLGSNPLVYSNKIFENSYNFVRRNFFKRTDKYRKIKETIEVFGEFERALQPFDRILPIFALGLFYGFSPYGNDVCRARKLSENSTAIEAVTKRLVQTCVDYARRCFPDDTIMQVAELYLHGLIFPPMLSQGEFPLQQAVAGVVKFIKEYGVSYDMALALCQCLMQCPDYHIATTGITIYAAIAEQSTRQALISACILGDNLSFFRPAMLLARKELKQQNDWSGMEFKSTAEMQHIKVERELGFIPWICLPDEFLAKDINQENMRQMLSALASLKHTKALRLLNEAVQFNPEDADLKLQLAFFRTVVLGDFKNTPKICREIIESSENAGSHIVYKLWAYSEILSGENALAYRHLVSALENCPEDNEEYANISHMLFIASTQGREHLEDAEKYSASSISHHKGFVRHGLFRYYWLIGNGRKAEADELLNKLFLFAPLDKNILNQKIGAGDGI